MLFVFVSLWRSNLARLGSLALLTPFCFAQAQSETGTIVHFREPHGRRYVLEQTPQTATKPKDWVRARPEGSTSTVELGNRVALKLKPGFQIESFLSDQTLVVSRRVSSNLFILQAKDAPSAIMTAQALSARDGVEAAYPVMRRPHKHREAFAATPDDTYFSDQWYLDNRGADGNLAGPDLNIRGAWTQTRGEGVLVAIADEGFQLDHPELQERANGSPHFNFFNATADGSPYSDDANHGTAVAGLVGAEGNNKKGISGVAPGAKLASWVIFGEGSGGTESTATDENLMDMFQYESDRVAVQNHSWGSSILEQSPTDALSDSGIENAVTKGRAGKGVVLVRAGGNSRMDLSNVNDDGLSNDPRQIAVAAVRKDGRVCSYSSAGACLIAAAPSGDTIDTDGDGTPDAPDPAAPDVLTTDRTGDPGYTSGTDDKADYAGFNGTSAASPQIAGVVALMLSANPALSYRDVQHILAHAGRHYDFADPDMRTNGAGFIVSHNVGFGIPDAGFAVQLAKSWPLLAAPERVTSASTETQEIPDDSLRLLCSNAELPSNLASIHSLASFGPHPDQATPEVPLVYVGQANEEITQDLHGKGALIQRGVSFFSDKIARAARAGAEFAVIFNNTGTTAIQPLGGTYFVPIRAISISKDDGEALRDFIADHSDTTAKIRLSPAVYRFNIPDTLICGHIGVHLQTTHSSRSDVRVTLVSPMGTRSILQTLNEDTTPGPEDWTYWSTQHFYESSAGEWRLEVSDELNTTVRQFPSGSIAATGSVTYAELIIEGSRIKDADADGLDDDWEMKHFGDLHYGPKDDPDHDGFNNAREQAMGTDPATPNAEFKVDFAPFKTGYSRLSWPATPGVDYLVRTRPDLSAPFTTLATVPGRLPISDFVIEQKEGEGFYVIQQSALPAK
jgi:subtilisin family serine protease/subtilisin-like proprotein convertase family protein